MRVILMGGAPSSAVLMALASIGATEVEVRSAPPGDRIQGAEASSISVGEMGCRDPGCPFCKAEQAISTRGRTAGTRVRDEIGRVGTIIAIDNGHEVVQFDGDMRVTVHVGATMDGLTAIEPEGEQAAAQPRDVLSRDARFDPLKAIQAMMEDVANDEVVAVALVGITSGGAVRLISSESTGQTLNMLAQGIQVADGTLSPEDPDEV